MNMRQRGMALPLRRAVLLEKRWFSSFGEEVILLADRPLGTTGGARKVRCGWRTRLTGEGGGQRDDHPGTTYIVLPFGGHTPKWLDVEKKH